MLLKQQCNSPLPERPRGVHEFRAALASVYLHTDPRGDASCALTPAMRPLSLPSAIKTIQDLPRDLQPGAQQHATFKLASAVFADGNREFRPSLDDLLGVDQANDLEERIREFSSGSLGLSPYDVIRRVVYDQGSRPIQGGADGQPYEGGERPPEGGERPPDRQASLIQPLIIGQALAQGGRPESTLDLLTLVTTVAIPSTSNLPFEQLATTLDPRNWSKSPFWPQSVQVTPDTTGLDFTLAAQTTQRGQSWDGFLFEEVEWNWNTSTVSSFRNFLKLDFQVNEAQQTIDLTFSLHSCEGSELYALVSKRGVDTDFGVQHVDPPGPTGAGLSRIRTVKNVRFSDTLNRRTPFEGAAGSGAMLVYLAPALVGLWMNDLLSRINA